VLGHLELLIDTSEEAGPVRPALRLIYQEADRAAKIVRNLLVFTGAQRMTRRRLRIDRVVKRALASRGAALKAAGITVVHQPDSDLPPVSADPLLLQQALLNVLINAEHAIAEIDRPGRIEIATGTSRGGAFVVLSVKDSGPGIAPDALSRIFDPFFTTKDVGKGTGLGLAITYGIIQEHGGTIQAANAPGGGAVMTIELPAILQSPVKYSTNG
jgi:C4-dicarboxylate-specific signal transduction histidine kinase